MCNSLNLAGTFTLVWIWRRLVNRAEHGLRSPMVKQKSMSSRMRLTLMLGPDEFDAPDEAKPR